MRYHCYRSVPMNCMLFDGIDTVSAATCSCISRAISAKPTGGFSR